MPSNRVPGEMEAYIQSVEERFDAAMQQQRTQHVDDIRLLVEKYTCQKIELLRERDAIQAAREGEAEEAQEAYQELEREKEELEEENEEREELDEEKEQFERDKEEWEEEKEEYERDKVDLEKDKRLWRISKKEFKRQTEVWHAEKNRWEREKREWEASKNREKRKMQALEDEARMLKAKSQSLERKVARMEARATTANREHVKSSADHVYWQRQYRAALAERNEWLQRYAPPPTLSTETLTTIAAFVSGNNDFKTLASMSATSKKMAQEIKPILWETVVWSDALAARFKAGEAEEYPDEFQHIKFLFVLSRLWDPKLEGDCLPNLRAAMIQNLNPTETFPNDAAPPRHTITLRIIRDTTCATLSSVLKCHVDWRKRAYDPPNRSRVAGISDVFIDGEATLALGDVKPNTLFKPTVTHARHIHLEKSAEQGEAGDIRLDTSIRALCKFVLPKSTDRVILRRPQLAIWCDHPAVLSAWLEGLPSWLGRNCDLSPTINLSFGRDIASPDFLAYARSFVDLYKNLWPEKFHLREHMRERLANGMSRLEKRIFRLVAYAPNKTDVASFRAVLNKVEGREGFHVQIEEYAPLQVKVELGASRYDVTVLEDRHEEPVSRRLGPCALGTGDIMGQSDSDLSELSSDGEEEA